MLDVARAPATIAGVRIDPYSFDEVVDTIVGHVTTLGKPAYVVTPNAHHVVLFQDDPAFRQIYDDAFLVVPDGVPLLWAAKILRQTLYGRVNGTDLFEAICARAAECDLRVFLLGGRKGAAEAARALLESRHPSLTICGTYCPPLGFERDGGEQTKIREQIATARPDILFVGLGAPKQEYWMHENRLALNVPMLLGIGVSFELVGGIVRRAPAWMQSAGLEWLFRMIAEPRRLWKRYVLGNARFCALIAVQWFMLHRARLPHVHRLDESTRIAPVQHVEID